MDASNQNELNYFEKLISLVRKRPGMYIYPETLENIRNFFSGYNCYHLIREPESVGIFDRYDPSFGDWVAKKEGVRNSPDCGWVEAIMKNAETDDEGIERFFKHLDDYIEEVVKKEKESGRP